ncbi:MAG TPA: isochorismatase family protein [Syntrophales bacterium]|nr:isochorismatase family protein [Syntrophales bacterium]
MREQKLIVLPAELQPIEVDLNRTAVIVVDMQNTFVSKGGMFDSFGIDLSSSIKIIQPIQRITAAARSAGVKVIYIVHRISSDWHEVGPNSPFWFAKTSTIYRERQELRDKLIVRGTWGVEIIDELKPDKDDVVIEKLRYSAFSGTNLDMFLKNYDIKYLIFTGVATNICVESSIRDAYHLEYFPILISDATATEPPKQQDATIRNVKLCFGWVTSCEHVIQALQLR